MRSHRSGIRHDYKDLTERRPRAGRQGWSWFAIGLSLPIVTVSLLLVSERNESKVTVPEQRVGPIAGDEIVATAREAIPLKLPASPFAPSTIELPKDSAAASSLMTLDLVVERGDTLDVLFQRNGLSRADLAAMVALPDAVDYLRHLRPGDEIQIVHAAGRIDSLRRELNRKDVLSITKSGTGFSVEKQQRSIETRTVGAHGVIRSSLFESGVAAGMADSVTMDMAWIFQWDIDFIQDVRLGDAFTVVYEEIWRDGVKLGEGDILSAEFVNQGKVYRAARYTDAQGSSDYYTPEANSVRRAFRRAPVESTRISSNFNPNRRHPVLNTIRAHRGVDYAAPTGTPVVAAGDGKIISRGVNGGYGNAVVLQHGGNITTLYGHLSRFGKQKVGSRVKQGDVIGYVGKTGLATGPHLHYEYRVAGTHKNPQTVALPPADPVPTEYRADFQAKTAPLWRQLDLYRQTQLAASAD